MPPKSSKGGSRILPARRARPSAAKMAAGLRLPDIPEGVSYQGYREQLLGSPGPSQPHRKMRRWWLKDNQGVEHTAVETVKWDERLKRFEYTAVGEFANMLEMTCYSHKNVHEYLDLFVNPGKFVGMGAVRDTEPENAVPKENGADARKKRKCDKLDTKDDSNSLQTTKNEEMGEDKVEVGDQEQDAVVQKKPAKSQGSPKKQLDPKAIEESDGLLKNVIAELTSLQATFGVRYSLTLIGPHGDVKVVASPSVQKIQMDPDELASLPYPKKMNILSDAAEKALQEVHDSEGYGLWPWEKQIPSPSQSDEEEDVKTQDVADEAVFQAKQEVKFTQGDDDIIDYADSEAHSVTPGLAAVVEFVGETTETPYLSGSFWRRDPFPSVAIQNPVDTMVISSDGGQQKDMERIKEFLKALPSKSASQGKSSLLVLDNDPIPCDTSDLFIVPVWGIDAYTRALLDLALASCEGGILSRHKRNVFFDLYFFPQLNKLQLEGWDSLKALEVIGKDEAAPEEIRLAATGAHKLMDILEQTNGTGLPLQRYQPLRPSGRKYSRSHPKGDGVVLSKESGLTSGSFVGYYGGDVAMPWRFYEREVSRLSRGNSKSQCILSTHAVTLERPDVDNLGSFVLYVDATQSANFASRINHSCSPNCALKTFLVHGELKLGIWTLRDIKDGEELTIDFRTKGDFERELQGLACLCGSEHCERNFVNMLVPTSPINSFMMEKYTILQRTKTLLQSVQAGLTRNDISRLERYGFKKILLDDALDVEATYPVPKWLKTWAAQTLGVIEEESEELRNVLQTSECDPDELGYRLEDVNRLASCRVKLLMVAMDKARFFLNNQDSANSKEPPIQLLSSASIADHLWNSSNSIARRAIKAIEGYLQSLAAVSIGSKRSSRQKELARNKADKAPWWKHLDDEMHIEYLSVEEVLQRMKELVESEKPKNAQAAQLALRDLAAVAAEGGPVHAGLHDLLLMYSYTKSYFSQTDFKPFKPVLANGGVGARYRPSFLWALLSGWYKNVGDVVEALGLDRKGVLCLPDVECTYQATFTNGEYMKSEERKNLVKFFEGEVAAVWPRNLPSFTFKITSQFFGSPQLDAVLNDGDDRGLEALVAHLESSFADIVLT
jgi:hypothetical protein